MKQIQIPEELFILLMKYHLLNMEEVQPEIEKGLMDKMDSIMMRLLYSKYKTAPTEEEKNIWISVEYQRVSVGNFFFGDINRSVARPCVI